MKVINLKSETEGVPSSAIREVALLKELDHPNIVKLIDVIYQPQKLILMFEYCDYDLRRYLHDNNNTLHPLEIRHIIAQILSAVEHCHSKKIIHRDLKLMNVLVKRRNGGAGGGGGQFSSKPTFLDTTIKLGDFGLARSFAIPVRSFTKDAVTLWYRPPDLLLGSENYTTSVDLWSIGCIMAELFNGEALFPGVSEDDQLRKIFEVVGMPNKMSWPELESLPKWKTWETQPIIGTGLAPRVRCDPVALDLLQVRRLTFPTYQSVTFRSICRNSWC